MSFDGVDILKENAKRLSRQKFLLGEFLWSDCWRPNCCRRNPVAQSQMASNNAEDVLWA
jgi:hypothetical protein